MRILVTFAIDAEFAQWKSRHPYVPYEFGESGRRREFDLLRANIGANEVTVLLTGMGGRNAKKAMSTIPLEQHDVCLCTGLAGALDPNLKLGEIVVGRCAESADRTRKAESDPDLVRFALALGARAVNVFVTSDTIVATADEKQLLSTSGGVVEMETHHILAAARQFHLPAVAVRAISDVADEDLPVDFERIADSHGHMKVGGLLKELALHPHRLPPLVRFGRQSRAAAGTLADFLDRYIPAVEKQWHTVRWAKIEEISAT
jgi:adenosylhomocysteine nucleosidase